MSNEQSILERAQAIVNGQRQSDYGPAKENLERIASVWSVVLGVPVTCEQVILCMIGLKMARLVHSPNHEDSWLDIAGYLLLKDKVNRGE